MEPLKRLELLATQRKILQGELRETHRKMRREARRARDAGATVQQIADAIGLTRPGVYDLMAAVKDGRR